MPIKAAFFDLGGVLLNFSHQKMYENLAQFSGLPLSVITQILVDEGLGLKYERGEVSSDQLHEKFCELSKKPLDYPRLLEAAGDIFSVKNETLSLVEQLSEMGLPLYVLSNTCEAHFMFLQNHFPHLLAPFRDFILSYKVKRCKPEEQIYEAALAMAGCAPEETFYTDDISDYVTAAKLLGINAHHFEGAEGTNLALKNYGISIR